MKGLLKTLVVIVFHVLTLASKGMAIYCFGKKQTWVDSMNACLAQRGTPLPYMRGLGNILHTQLLRDGTFWTSEYLKTSGSKSEELCGFRFMSAPFDIGQVFYGDCNKNRSYICWDSTSSKGTIEEGNHELAINTCDVVNIDVLYKIANIFKPGYYWIKDSLIFIRRARVNVLYTGGRYEMTKIPNRNLIKCGAYSRDAGLYFRRCSDQISSVCHFMNQPDTDVFRTCFKDSTTATKIITVTTGFTTPIKVVSTNEQFVDQSKETIKTAVMTSINSTESNIRDSTMQLVAKSTSTENESKTQKDRDLGTKVGLPVGLCLALLCVIILSIYISRRYRCWNTAGKENNNTKAKHPNKQSSTGRVVAHVNNSYEASEDVIAIKITNQEVMNDESNGLDKRPHYTDLDSEYDVAYKRNLGQNSEERYNITETDYDVTGHVPSCTSKTSNNIYNHFQSEEYDSSANVKRGDICNNVYGITQSKDSESVYYSTKQVNGSSPCDNVYNQLSQAISRDEQNYYDSTFNTSKIGQTKVIDQTYDKLK